jgi:hypothetical protein
MKYLAAVTALIAGCAQAGSAPDLPIAPGRYAFQHRFVEQPNIPSIRLTAKITGARIVLTNQGASDVFPKGVVAEGTLMWHAASKQWIIGHAPSDRYAEEVGGCTDGPEVIDLHKRTYWTC